MLPQPETVYLVYFDCRGIAQPIRYTLFEIDIPFVQVFLSLNGQQHPLVQRFNLNRKSIPCLIHENRVIKQLYPIMKYLCYRFNRIDLLGTDVKTQAKLLEVFFRFQKKKCSTLMTIFTNVSDLIKNPDKQQEIKENLMKQLTENNLGFEQACIQLYSNSGTFLFDQLTILDFVFYEKAFYFSNMFGDIAKKKYPIIFAYKNYFEKTLFYNNNKHRIEKYKLMMPEFDASINQGLKKLWVGEIKFFC